jgi:hypothetical protein
MCPLDFGMIAEIISPQGVGVALLRGMRPGGKLGLRLRLRLRRVV